MVYKIGIVDDEPEVAQTLTDMLTRYKEDKNSDGGGYGSNSISVHTRAAKNF